MLRNPRAHRNRRGDRGSPPSGVEVAAPETPEALRATLRRWAEQGVGRLVIDGGDGTVREVMAALPEAFAGRDVRVAVLASGKTNALARDLGARAGWTLKAALASPRTAERSPVEVVRAGADGPPLRGFVLGAGVFSDVIALAQPLHRARLWGRPAVGAALATAVAKGLFGGDAHPWRRGRLMRFGPDAGAAPRRRFIVLLSTLERLPLHLRPFGPPRPGLKALDVDAPPRRLAEALPLILAGRDRPWLEAAGYRRRDVEQVHLATDDPFILDGELFPGGDLVIRRGAPVTFVVP